MTNGCEGEITLKHFRMSLFRLEKKQIFSWPAQNHFPSSCIVLTTWKRSSVLGRHTVKHKHFPALYNFFKVKILSP